MGRLEYFSTVTPIETLLLTLSENLGHQNGSDILKQLARDSNLRLLSKKASECGGLFAILVFKTVHGIIEPGLQVVAELYQLSAMLLEPARSDLALAAWCCSA